MPIAVSQDSNPSAKYMKDHYIHATSLAQANVYKQQYFASLLYNRAHPACFRIAISTVLAVAASAGPSLVQ